MGEPATIEREGQTMSRVIETGSEYEIAMSSAGTVEVTDRMKANGNMSRLMASVRIGAMVYVAGLIYNETGQTLETHVED
jgi:hypothetical protein